MGPATDKHQAPTHRLKLYIRAVIESGACDPLSLRAKNLSLYILLTSGVQFKCQILNLCSYVVFYWNLIIDMFYLKKGRTPCTCTYLIVGE